MAWVRAWVQGGVSYHVHVGVGAGMGAAAVYLTFPNFSKSENPPNRSKPCPSVPTPGAERSRDYGLPAPSGRARTEGCTDGLTCKPGAYPARALERAAVPRPYPNLSSGNGPYRRESPEPRKTEGVLLFEFSNLPRLSLRGRTRYMGGQRVRALHRESRLRRATVSRRRARA